MGVLSLAGPLFGLAGVGAGVTLRGRADDGCIWRSYQTYLSTFGNRQWRLRTHHQLVASRHHIRPSHSWLISSVERKAFNSAKKYSASSRSTFPVHPFSVSSTLHFAPGAYLSLAFYRSGPLSYPSWVTLIDFSMNAAQSSTVTITMKQEAVDYRDDAAFCRAIYDYKASDTSSISFRKNDILEVVNRLESGWWDGFLGDARGWFPSNYVAIISNEEAKTLGYGLQTSPQPLPDPSSYGKGSTMGGILEGDESEDDWLHSDMERSSSSNSLLEHDSFEPSTETSDFWLPEVTPDGQVIDSPQCHLPCASIDCGRNF